MDKGHTDGIHIQKVRDVIDIPVEWRPCIENEIAMEVIGDSEIVINWLNGAAAVNCPDYCTRARNLVCRISSAWVSGHIVPRTAASDWYRHVYRELNKEADD